jgi:hypothetical protein
MLYYLETLSLIISRKCRGILEIYIIANEEVEVKLPLIYCIGKKHTEREREREKKSNNKSIT